MTDRARKSGQIVLVLAFMLLGLLLLTLVGVDVFLSAHRKNRLQNAGDAAALAAARWQGITLNALGALNLAKIDALCKVGDPSQNPAEWDAATNVCERITALQERLAFAGPLMGFYAAQHAALKNGLDEPDRDMGALVSEAMSRAAMLPGTELWPEKASDYADMLHSVSRDGIFAGADNAQFFNFAAQANHPLYSRAFYEAVDGADWCWFYLHGMLDLLKGFSGWDEIPFGGTGSPQNPEFFGTGVHFVRGALTSLAGNWNEQQTRAAVLELANRSRCPNVTEYSLQQCGVLTNPHLSWVAYGSDWHAWNRMHISDEARLPLISDVKDEYNVEGAFAAARVRQVFRPFTPGVSSRVNVWTAAAKPFGSIDDSTTVTWNGEFPFVAPAFTDVRLVMLGAFNEGSMGMSDLEWVTHTRDHIQPPDSVTHVDGCRYCAILKKWENRDFRAAGVAWIEEFGEDQCRRPTGGGGSPGGGTRHAH